jgi:hypothetical protein
MASLQELLDRLWEDYTALNPQAHRIHELLKQRGETVRNDHVAFRTYNDPRVDLEKLAAPFLKFGYEAKGDYQFVEKRLFAKHFEHPEEDKPKIFISELKTEEFSDDFRALVNKLVDQVPEGATDRWDWPVMGRPWEVSTEEYERLRRESEYGAWMAAFGFRANHFTIDVNALESFESLQQFNEFLKGNGFELNAAGGEIKGSPEMYLEQSATLAPDVEVSFRDGTRRIPSCYYEFARRYRMPDGKMFNGFVARSADKIFQSTDRRGE